MRPDHKGYARQAFEGCRNVGSGIAGMTVQDLKAMSPVEPEDMDEDLARAKAL